jgi:hypothetical protein
LTKTFQPSPIISIRLAWDSSKRLINLKKGKYMYLPRIVNKSFRSVSGLLERRRETVSSTPRPRNGSGKDSRGKQTMEGKK